MLCTVLAAALFCMALAVLVQALAVLVLAALAAVVLLPHPLKWYAEQGGGAVGVFFDSLLNSFGHGRKQDAAAPERDDEGSR